MNSNKVIPIIFAVASVIGVAMYFATMKLTENSGLTNEIEERKSDSLASYEKTQNEARARIHDSLMKSNKPYRDSVRAAAVINRWVQMFCNHRRRHTSIGGMSPVEFEEQWFQRRRLSNVSYVS